MKCFTCHFNKINNVLPSPVQHLLYNLPFCWENITIWAICIFPRQHRVPRPSPCLSHFVKVSLQMNSSHCGRKRSEKCVNIWRQYCCYICDLLLKKVRLKQHLHIIKQRDEIELMLKSVARLGDWSGIFSLTYMNSMSAFIKKNRNETWVNDSILNDQEGL